MKRASFTLIEVVLVLVITGLVGVVGSMAIVQITQNYAIQKKYAELEIDSASTIRQISKYLQNSIWDSIATRNGTGRNNYTPISEINGVSDTNSQITNSMILVFIEKNQDIINGRYVGTATVEGQSITYNSNLPYFSGFVDLANSSGLNIIASFPMDSVVETTIADVFKDNINSNGNASLYFPFVNVSGDIYDKYYNTSTSTYKTALFGITDVSRFVVGNYYYALMVLDHAPSRIGDVATIVNSEPVTIAKDTSNNLILRRNNNGTIEEVVIAQGISNVYIWSEAASSLIRVRLCYTNEIMDFMPEFCKEGVIMQ